MRRIIPIIFIASVLIFITPKSSIAQKYATCDVCGLCPKIESPLNGATSTCTVDSNQVPGDWKSCVKCLYPTLYPPASNPDPTTCDTLRIEDTSNLLTNPVEVGRQFTMLGCVTSGSSVSFFDGKGAPSVVQKLLDVIFSLAGGLAFLYLMYGGFVILTSQADAERLNYGRRLIYGAIIGLIITLASVFIVNFVGSGILRIPGFSGAI